MTTKTLKKISENPNLVAFCNRIRIAKRDKKQFNNK